MLMREHYASQEEQTQLEELAILKNNFLRSFSVALRNRERVLRVLDLTVHHYSVPLTAARSTGQVGTWSAFLLDVNYLIGPARRMVTWMEGRGLDVIISLHAFDQGVITHDPKSELLIRPIETSPPLHGQWVTVSGREDRKLAILFARVY